MKTQAEIQVLNRILSTMKEKGFTAVALCKALGYKSSQAVTNWKLDDNTSYMKKLPQIAAILDVPLDYLLRGRVDYPAIHSNDFSQILPYETRGKRPVVGNVSAGTGTIASQDIIGWQNVDNAYDNDNFFWLRVSGDSMAPKIDNGDLILIDKGAQIDNGNIVVALIENEGFIKKVEIKGDTITLISFNPYYPPMVFVKEEAEKIYFVGRVVKQERDL